MWYKIHLPTWSDGPGRASRYISHNGTMPMTLLPTEVTNADKNLWRLEGTSINGAQLVSRDGKRMTVSSTANDAAVKLAADGGDGTLCDIYTSNKFSNSYYLGIASRRAARMNACGLVPNGEKIAWGLALYDEDDNASSFYFTQVFGTKVSVIAPTEGGTVYINKEGNAATEVMSEMEYTLHAVAADGYSFKEWKQGETTVGTTEDLTIKAPALTENTVTPAYTAVFEKGTVTYTPVPKFDTVKTSFMVGSTAEIAVSCSEASAVIYYTLDGVDPTEASSVATDGKIVLNSSAVKAYTVKIMAKAPEMVASRVATATYSIVSSNAPAALLPIPNERQLKYLHAPNAAFIHYGMNTYTNKEWGDGYESPSSFNPPKVVDTDQWASVLKECGFDRVILTGKHHDGFCLWPSKANKVNPHTIAQSPYLDGKGDLFESLSLSCSKYDLDMGVYLSPWDVYEEQVGGNYTSEKYNDFYIEQLNEVLGSYGKLNPTTGKREVVEVWLDGATGSNNPPVYTYDKFVETMRKHQPDAFVWIDNGNAFTLCSDGENCSIDGSWGESEGGDVPDPCWNKMTPGSSSASQSKNKENGKYFHVLEADVSMRSGWFYSDGGGLKTAKQLFNDCYLRSIGRGAPLIINVPPTKDGVFADNYVEVLKKYKEYIDVTFKRSLIPEGATASATQVREDLSDFNAAKAIDGNYDTYWTMNDGQTTGALTVELGKTVRFDIVEMQEYIELGQRIKSWKVEVRVDGEWKVFGQGSTMGFRRLLKSKQVEADALRLTINNSLAVPLINSLAIYQSHADLVESDLPPVSGVDGQFEMATDFKAALETDGTVTVNVKLKDRSDKAVSVYVSTSPGTGVQGKVYEDKSATLTFAPGVIEKEFTVNLINNTNDEGTKDFYIGLSTPSDEATLGGLVKTRVLVFDDEQTIESRTITIKSSDANKGAVSFFFPGGVTETSLTTDSPVITKADAKAPYTFLRWENDKNEVVSTDAMYINTVDGDQNITAIFDVAYPAVTHGYSNNVNQQNRYLKKVETTGTNTPVVFEATTIQELPYTEYPSASLGKYTEVGALIDKTANPILLDINSTSFDIKFYGWTSYIGTYPSELNWTQQAYFIDWNGDGSFTDEGEIGPKSSNTIGNDGGVSSSFISATGYQRTIPVPANQPEGVYRMRVVYYEPQNNSEAWQESLFTTKNGQVRNGVAYDFNIQVKDLSGVGETSATDNTKVYGAAGEIVFEVPGDVTPVKIFNISGMLVASENIQGVQTIKLSQGVYIAVVGNKSYKVLVY